MVSSRQRLSFDADDWLPGSIKKQLRAKPNAKTFKQKGLKRKVLKKSLRRSPIKVMKPDTIDDGLRVDDGATKAAGAPDRPRVVRILVGAARVAATAAPILMGVLSIARGGLGGLVANKGIRKPIAVSALQTL